MALFAGAVVIALVVVFCFWLKTDRYAVYLEGELFRLQTTDTELRLIIAEHVNEYRQNELKRDKYLRSLEPPPSPAPSEPQPIKAVSFHKADDFEQGARVRQDIEEILPGPDPNRPMPQPVFDLNVRDPQTCLVIGENVLCGPRHFTVDPNRLAPPLAPHEGRWNQYEHVFAEEDL